MLNYYQHLQPSSMNERGNGSRLSRHTKAIKAGFLSAAALFLFTCLAQAQNYCPTPGNPKYDEWVDRQAFSGNHRVCTPNERQRGWGGGGKAEFSRSGVTVGGNVEYSNSTNRRSWDCGKNNLPRQGEPYYIKDHGKSGIQTEPRIYRGW